MDYNKIRKIEVKNFFGQGDFEWNLNQSVNILGGKNGTGKSALFKMCIRMLSDVDLGSDLLEHNCDEIKLLMTNGNIIRWNKETKTYDLVDDDGNIIDSSERTEQADCFYFSPSMHSSMEIDDLIEQRINWRNAAFVKDFEDYMKKPESELVNFKQSVKLASRNYLYHVIHHFFTDYESNIGSDFVFTKFGRKINYYELSYGEKELLLLLLKTDYTNCLPCIFFLDMPEYNLHIDWQEILIREMLELNPNMQLIVTTHSPSIITGWKDRVNEISDMINNKTNKPE